MTVGELIERLEQLDEQDTVFFALRQHRTDLALSVDEAVELGEDERAGVYLEGSEVGYAPRD